MHRGFIFVGAGNGHGAGEKKKCQGAGPVSGSCHISS
jgi:hypothetical protein